MNMLISVIILMKSCYFIVQPMHCNVILAAIVGPFSSKMDGGMYTAVILAYHW
jgi:hypothetical protein